MEGYPSFLFVVKIQPMGYMMDSSFAKRVSLSALTLFPVTVFSASMSPRTEKFLFVISTFFSVSLIQNVRLLFTLNLVMGLSFLKL